MQAQPWAEQLQALGATVSLQSMMLIEPVTEPSTQQAIKTHILAFDEYHKAIFISQNAVKYGLQWLDQYWPQLPVGVDFFAIGKATATLLVNSGIIVSEATEAMNTEALLEHPSLQDVSQQKILIFRGQGGRHQLAEVLTSRGADVSYCELYTRQAPPPQALDQSFKNTVKQAVTVVHSGETLENLCQVMSSEELAWLQQQPLLLPGARVADIAHRAGFHHKIVARNATHDSMLEALYEWQKK